MLFRPVLCPPAAPSWRSKALGWSEVLGGRAAGRMPASLQAICGRGFQKGQLQLTQMNCETLFGLKALKSGCFWWGDGGGEDYEREGPGSQQGCHWSALVSGLWPSVYYMPGPWASETGVTQGGHGELTAEAQWGDGETGKCFYRGNTGL